MSVAVSARRCATSAAGLPQKNIDRRYVGIKTSNIASLFFILALILVTAAAVQAQSAYEVVAVPNGGTIAGVVKWTGERPKAITLPITKDQTTCDPDRTGTRDLGRLVIGADGGVENTVVFLKGITQGKAWDLPEARRQLDQKSCRYVPHVLLVPA